MTGGPSTKIARDGGAAGDAVPHLSPEETPVKRSALRTAVAALALTAPLTLTACAGGEGGEQEDGGGGGQTEQEGGDEDDGDGY